MSVGRIQSHLIPLLLATAILIGSSFLLSGNVAASSTHTPADLTEDFSTFDGSGFTPSPAAGQLDSDLWIVTGMSDGDMNYGDTATGGDFARGPSTGGVTTGGIYAFDVGGGNTALGVQPGGSDWTPGTLELRLQNQSGAVLDTIEIDYTVYALNDQTRANSFNFAYSTDGTTWTAVPTLDYTSPEAPDGLGWVGNPRTVTLAGLNIADGAFYYLRWQGDDVSGSGGRDEFALDDVSVVEVTASAACDGLFISEYIEGSGINKAVEIYNGTGAAVDLSSYSILVYNNGSTTVSQTVPLIGTVADGDVFVLARDGADPAILAEADQTTTAGLWNGNDAVELSNDGSPVDVIGQIGVDPGAAWGSPPTTTANATLIRMASVSAGDPDGSDPFDPATEWEGYPEDTFTFLGSHSADCGGSGGPTPTPGPTATPTATPTPLPLTLIHEIQGAGTTSPMVGMDVAVEAVVVGDFQTSDGLRGFFLQEEDSDVDGDPLTSEGIFVYDGSSPAVDVAEGDLVRVEGPVSEYADRTEGGGTLTEISAALVTILGTGPAVTPATPTLPEATDGELEAVEGMLVTIDSLTVAQNYFLGRYGQMTMSASGRLYQPTNQAMPGSPEAQAIADLNARSILILDDGQAGSRCGDNPLPVPYLGPPPGMVLRAGDTATNLLGVIDYGQINSGSTGSCASGSTLFAGDFRLHPVTPPTFINDNPRPATPEDVGGDFQVAAFNVLNYFNGDGMGGGFPTPRGADTLEEFVRQRTKIIDAIVTMDAEVIGLMELENDFTDGANSAIADLTNGLNEATAPGTYAYIDPGTNVGTDEISVGILYKPAAVVPVGTLAILDDPAFTDPNNLGSQQSRPAMAQTFEVRDSSLNSTGGVFTVVVNHLKSKGSSCGPGDDDNTTGQGNCNLTRTLGAQYLVETWLPSDPTGTAALYGTQDTDYLITGDLNSYAMEDPIRAITDQGYTDLIWQYTGGTGYSYIFDGQSGYLDHALSSPSLTDQVVGTTVWHINTDEAAVLDYNEEFNSGPYYEENPFRSSDHDPVIVGMVLLPTADFGDSPASYGEAWHSGAGELRLGQAWDTDTVGAAAGSDDPTDDGVTMGYDGTLTQMNVEVVVTRTDGGTDGAWLAAWVDWDENGTFEATELMINQAVVVGTNSLSFGVPASADPSGTRYVARYRLYDSQTEPEAVLAVAATGGVVGGEVEDYLTPLATPTAVTLDSVQSSATPRTGLVIALLTLGLATLAIARRRYHQG